jgi:hypothetical protein
MGEWDFQVMATDEANKDASEMTAREQFLRENPPVSGIVSPGDLRTIDLIHRPWRNNKGLWFQLGDNNIIQAHLSEIPPGANTTRYEWAEGTLFSPPVWAWHQHFNADPDETARYLAIQDTGLLRHMRLHRIERHPTQIKVGEGTDYAVDNVAAPTAQETVPAGGA